ncbi:MAG: hypothetical protein H6954_04090 [Chromatiaceae bacterium]|nr:hypothetical protein [Chromatiaceae bacterium]
MMGTDRIKQTDNIARVQPQNPARGTGQRQRPQQKNERVEEEDNRQPRDDGHPHKVDEYV